MFRRTTLITFPFILVFSIYFLGPEPDEPLWNPEKIVVPSSSDELEKYVAVNESRHRLKQDNEARIIWADSSRMKTEYSVVYIHGFSASQGEGKPIHEEFAKRFGCNLYLTRMADHGIDTTEQLLYFTPDRWWKSSKEALAIGKELGKKVILMSTSTGGTMALVLAARYPEDVFALMSLSPNIAINDPLAWVANNPWGLQIARLVKGGDYIVKSVQSGADSVLEKRYWNVKYRLEAACQLQELLEDAMTEETFQKVTCPSLTLYYFKNEAEQDPSVKVSAMLEMNDLLGTPDSLKVMVPIPNAGAHVLGSPVVSKDIKSVREELEKFAVEKLRMKPVQQTPTPN
ncbi:MAG: alpha/beta hydrolase [Cytophagales bacterium]|nr:alpha/beta hydrolase [Cytophagales bacterium]